MTVRPKARARLRALLAATPLGASAGAILGLALGGAFLAGGMAKDAVIHSRVTKIAATLDQGLSDRSLEAMIQNDPSALSVALRYDRLYPAPESGMAHQEAALAASLEARAQSRMLHQASAPMSRPVAARPWTASPLDQARQLDCLAEAVYYEARGETPAGQAAVAQVVLNRVRHPAFPKSICAVVYQGAESHHCQFSFACNGAARANREPGAWIRARRVAERSLGGYVMVDVGNATHFHLLSIRTAWKNMSLVSQIGSHMFYKFGGRNGAPDAFTAEPQAEPAPYLVLASSASEPAAVEPQTVAPATPAKTGTSARPSSAAPQNGASAPAATTPPVTGAPNV